MLFGRLFCLLEDCGNKTYGVPSMKGVGKGTGASTQMPGIKGEKGEKGDPGQRDMLDLTATASPGGPTIIKAFTKVTAACNVEMTSTILLRKRALNELHRFEANRPGLFVRGSSFDSNTGRFSAPVSGIYQFYANLHITWNQTSGAKPKTSNRTKVYIRGLICINSQCSKKT
jgi:hypothetical protein